MSADDSPTRSHRHSSVAILPVQCVAIDRRNKELCPAAATVSRAGTVL